MADRYNLTWIDHTGQEWEFTSVDWIAGIRAGGVEGLVGEPEDVAIKYPGWAGQVLDSQEFPAMRGRIRFAVRGDGTRSADDVWAELRQSFHHRLYGTMLLHTPSVGMVSAQLRRSGSISPPAVDPASEDVILGADIPVVSDDGCWWMPEVTDTGIVTVTNSGDVPVWVKIRWKGDGGKVTVPSGASFELPPTAETRVLHLSAAESLVVLDEGGNLDRELWKKVRGVALPEVVPDGESRFFTVPEGAEVEYKVGVIDPWK